MAGVVIPPKDTSGATLVRVKAFANADDLRFRGTGVSTTISYGTTDNLDYKLTEDRFINGVNIILKDHTFDDTVCFQIVDVDDVLGYGAGVVLDEFGTNWGVCEDQQNQGQILISYPALVYTGLYVRIRYTSTGLVDVKLKANLFLHKKP
jgi:hypothetical protein